MMIGREKADDCRWIDSVKMRQAVRDRRRSPVVMRLDQQAIWGETRQLISEKAFVRPGQYQESLLIRHHTGYPPPRLI
jgi:hypothetical protein